MIERERHCDKEGRASEREGKVLKKKKKKEQTSICLQWAKLHVNPLAGGDLHCVGPVVLTHLPGSKSQGRPIDPNAADYYR